MDIYLEFIGNHSILFVALLLIIILLLQTLYSDVTRKYKLLTAPEVIGLINRDDAVIIDIRSPNEFKEGHIADAIHIPLSNIKAQSEKLKKYGERPLLFYCKSGMRADEACKILSKLGFTNVNALNGGVQSWLDANMPLVKK